MAGSRVVIKFVGEDKELGSSLDNIKRKIDENQMSWKTLGIASAVAMAAPVAAGAGLLAVPALFTAIGIAAMKSNADVKASFTNLGTQLKTDVATWTAPLVGTFTQIASMIGTTLKAIGPQMTQIFKLLAPALTPLVQGFMTLAINALPGFTAAMKTIQPIAQVIGVGLGQLGTAVSQFFTNLSTGSPGAVSAFQSIFQIVGSLLPTLGTLIASLANTLAPVLATVASALSGVFGWLNSIGPILGPLVLTFIGFGAALKIAQGAMALYNGVMTAWRVATGIATAAQWLWNAAMSANPIGIVIIILAALVAAVIYCYTHFQTFRDIVNGVWNAVKSAFSAGVNAIKGILAWFGTLPSLFSGWINGARAAIVNGFSSAVGWVRGVPGMILGALGNLGGLLVGAGRAIIDGFLNGLKSAWGAVTNFVSGIAGWIASHKGPITYDMTLLTPHGNAIMDGLLGGLQAGNSRVQSYVSGIASGLSDALSTNVSTNMSANVVSGMNAARGGYAAGSAGGVNMTFSGNTDSAMASAIMQMIRKGQIQIKGVNA